MMRSRPAKSAIARCVLAAATLIALAGVAEAARRPGGGSSFSGSSSGSRSSGSSHSSGSSYSSSHGSTFSSGSSSRSGSSGVGSSPIDSLVGLILGGVVLFVVVGIVWAGYSLREQDWEAGTGPAKQRTRIRPELEKLRQRDPNFSLVLLEDFLYALYAHAHTLRANGGIERLSAYLRPAARGSLTALGNVREVKSIIVGAMRYLAVSGTTGDAPEVKLVVEFESNYTEEPPAGAPQSFYAYERWTLSRSRDAMSRTPERARVLTCPSCGAPLDATIGGTCTYCRKAVDTGQFDWIVDAIEVQSREERGPLLTGNTEEEGTDLPTVVDPDAHLRFAELRTQDPGFAWPAFQARVGLIFGAMQTSWSNRSWPEVRPFVSDNLFQMLGYWIETYRRARLRNITEGARIERIELARVSSDQFYDALTVRLFASSFDYTIADDDGRIIAGSRQRTRRYSEYWTLIRGADRKGPARSDLACPSCGAPLQIEMAGHCIYCRAKVTSGAFDWVLSRIEQDEVYDG